MNALKAAVWISKLEDRRDALRLRLHTMGVKAFFNKDEQESVTPQRLSWKTLPAYLKEKALSGLLLLASLPVLLLGLLRPKSIIGGLFLAFFLLVGMVLLVVALISGSMYYYLSQPVDETQRQYYLNKHQQRIAITLHDNNNDLIGALPPPTQSDGNSTGALMVKTVPPVLWELLKAPADNALQFDNQPVGFWSLYKSIIQFKDTSYKGINLTAPYQGKPYASLLQHMAHSLHSTQPRVMQQQGFVGRLLNSKASLHMARHLYPYLAQNNGEAFKRWSAIHAPLLAANNDVYGLAAIAATLFGKKVERLTVGQQALLATAYHQQTPLAMLFTTREETTEVKQQRRSTWERLLKQTQQMATQHYKDSQPQLLKRIVADLQRMQSLPSAAMSAQWLNFLTKNPQYEAQYQSLLQRSELILGKLKPSVSQAVQAISAKQAADVMLTDVKISLPMLQNQQLATALQTTFKTIQRFYPTQFNKQLGNDIAKEGALISIHMANEQGHIIRSYQRGVVEQRPIANLSDIAIASLLLANKDTLKTRYCNKAYAGIRNANEPKRDGINNCKALNQKGRAFSLQQSIQQSKTLPLLYALTQKHTISAETLTTLYNNFGFWLENAVDHIPNAKTLAYELSIGAAQSTPEKMHQLIHALTRQLYNIPYNEQPSMIQSLQMSRLSASGEESFIQREIKSEALQIQAYFPDTRTQKAMRALFAIPSYKKYNPLKFLQSVEKKYGVDFLLVKSATSKTANNQTRDKWLIGSFRFKQHIYSFVIMVGSDDRSKGLGKHISHQQIMLPIVNTLIESLD